MKESRTFLTSPAVVTSVVGAYLLLLLLLLGAELGIPGLGWLRATNQVLVLLALLFLPFLLLAASRAVRSISVKLSGQELHFELAELRGEVHGEMKRVETRFAGQVSTAEQALWPMLAGRDPTSEDRWRRNEIIIGAKLDTSQTFFAHFLAVWLEQRVPGLRCLVRAPNGGSLKNFADLKHHWIDVYVDYTGTCCQYFNIDHHRKTPQQLVDELNEFGKTIGMRWLNRLGASEGYCLVMRRALAEAEGIKTIKDLTRIAGKLVLAADPEFLNRRDCYVGLLATYDLAFRAVEPCRITDRYALLANEQADIFVGYETDPELQSPSLLVLQDSDGFFPEYHALPVASTAVLGRVAGLEGALNDLRDVIGTADLIGLVQRLRHRGQRAAVVRELAEQFLLERRRSGQAS
jgi:glycine betaine/choline ABC-type transport system substrate-binding protein